MFAVVHFTALVYIGGNSKLLKVSNGNTLNHNAVDFNGKGIPLVINLLKGDVETLLYDPRVTYNRGG